MMGSKIRFKEAIWKLSINSPVYPFLSGALRLVEINGLLNR